MNFPKRNEYPEFLSPSTRLKTFENWPRKSTQKPEQLVDAGFFYMGIGDHVRCFSCGGVLKDWDVNDQPWEQHALWYKKCEYLKFMKGEDYITNVLNLNIPSKIDENRLCKICFEFEYNVVFMPCRHVVVCSQCAIKLKDCPYCRQQFKSVLRIYFT
jgi:baculoviral IAP repeat-containing protein 7/8